MQEILIFDQLGFYNLDAIKDYLQSKLAAAKKEQGVWLEHFSEPLSKFREVFEELFKRDRNAKTNRYPVYTYDNLQTRRIRVSLDPIPYHDLGSSIDYIDVTFTVDETGQVDRIEIRKHYPAIPNTTPPPWAQEVYTFSFMPAKQSKILKTDDGVNATLLLDGDVDIPLPPHLSVQPTAQFTQWEQASDIKPDDDRYDHHFTDPRKAAIVFQHGVDRIKEALQGPCICESYENPPDPPGTRSIPLTNKLDLFGPGIGNY